jgi:acetoin utilization deacetylase AcuC-like enzyme
MIFISAGFDAHVEDDMSGVSLTETDYRWVTEKIVEIADSYSEGRIVSTLEGGYALDALGRSVEAHLRVLMNLH